MSVIKSTGAAVIRRISNTAYFFGYAGRIFTKSLFFFRREKSAYKILVMQLLFTFIEALPIVAVLSAAMCSAMFVLGYEFLVSFGQGNLIYSLLAVIVIREVGPLLVAFVVTARSATAIATELGGMVTSHQIESYVAVGVDPIAHLVVPRFLGVTGSMFFLTLYFSICGLVCPYFVSLFTSPDVAAAYFSSMLGSLTIRTVATSVVKSIVFGMIISITSTFYGFNVERASTEVPVAGIQAVTKSFLWIIIADVLVIILSK